MGTNRLRAVPTLVLTLVVAGAGLVPASAPVNAGTLPNPRAEALARPNEGARGIAMRQARVTGHKIPIEEMTTATTKVWALPDGTYESNIASGPVRRKRDGRWHEVDLTLAKRADGTVAPAVHLHDLVISGPRPGGDHELASLASGNSRRAMLWHGALPDPVLDGQKATYVDVFPGIDLVVEARMTGYEQYTVVTGRAGLAHLDKALAALRIGARATRATVDSQGALAYADGSGQTVGHTAAPLMWDARIDAVTGEPRNVRKVGIAADGKAFGLAVDKAWLHDPTRSFPITIDPDDTNQWTAGDTYVDSNTPGQSYWTASDMGIGTTNGGAQRRIAYVNLTAANMTYATIHSASLGLFVKSGNGTACPAGGVWKVFGAQANAHSGTTWNNRPYLIDGYGNNLGTKNGNGVEGQYAYAPFGSNDAGSGNCVGQWIGARVDGLFQYAASRAWAEFTAVITPYWDNTNIYYRRFSAYNSGNYYPNATVNWSWPPTFKSRSTTPAMSCTGRPVVATATPTLSAAFDQNEGINVDVHFEYGEVGGSTTTVRWVTAGAGVTANYTIPAGELLDGRHYRWRTFAKSHKNVWSSTTDWCEFTVNVWAPPVAGCSAGARPVDGLGGDFNGDGTRDTVIADPYVTVAGVAEAGIVTIVDGATGARTVLDQNLAEVPDAVEPGDRFGWATAIVDLNQDGCSDLAVGTPFEDGAATDSGRVDALYGTAAGLGKGPAAESFTLGSGGMPGAENGWDTFGFSLAGGVTRAGDAFLIVGAPNDSAGASGSGAAYYIRDEHRLLLDGNLCGDADEGDDRAGYSVAATPDHFAVGAPGQNNGADHPFAGQVCVFQHTFVDGRPGLVKRLRQGMSPVSGSPEAGDQFGWSVSMAHYRAAGQADGTDSILVVGAPGEDTGSTADSGVVHELRIGGMTVTELAVVDQNTPGVSGANDAGDLFGHRVLVVNTSPAAEASATTLLLAVGSPGEDKAAQVDAGVVRVFAAGVPNVAGDAIVERAAGALPGTPAARELLGLAFGANPTELLVSAPVLAQRGVHAIKWSDLVAGTETVSRSWTPTSLAVPAHHFGFQVG